MQYCPVCLNESLALKSRGIVRFEINGKHLPNSVFVYNLETERLSEVLLNLEKKVEDFIKWYSSLNNRQPIESFVLYSTDFACSNKCFLNPNSRLSIVDILFTKDEVMEVLTKICNKYDIPMEQNISF